MTDRATCGPLNHGAFERVMRAKRYSTVVRRLTRLAAGKPLAVVGGFTMGVVKIVPVDPRAAVTLTRMCPEGPDHTWHTGEYGCGLLVEQRYANDIVAGLRERGVFVP